MISVVAAVAVALGLAAVPVTAQSAAVTGPVIAVAGDVSCEGPHSDTGDFCRSAATGDLIENSAARYVLALGDLQYEDGTLAAFQQRYDPDWGSFKAQTRPVPGNHEYHVAGADGYFDYFGATANRNNQGRQMFTVNGWTVIGLNTNCNLIGCGSMNNWLGNKLAAADGQCAIVYGHHPIYSSGQHGNTSWMGRFRATLNTYGVELYLAGHDHNYERFAPVGTDTFRQFVLGTGGKENEVLGTVKPGSEVRLREHGATFFTLGADSYGWEFQGLDGGILDAGTELCTP